MASALPFGLLPAAASAQALISRPVLPLLGGAPAPPVPAIPPLQLPAAAAAMPAVAAPTALPPVAFSTPAPPPPVPVAAPSPVPRTGSRGSAILLEQANYWSAQGRPERAHQALERLLLIEPGHAEVLATAAEVAVMNGDHAAAEGYLERVRQAAPGSAALARAVSALRVANVDQMVLAEARRLNQAGQREAAVQRYREIFPDGEVPDAFAAEYYQTLASLSLQGFLEARSALEAASARKPWNRGIQLALAQILVIREATRPEGFERLHALARVPEIAPGARAIWREALLWQGPSGESFGQIEQYVEVFPDDRDMAARLEAARVANQDPMARHRLAYDLLQTNPDEAGRLFSEVLADQADDVDALIGLGIVRRVQKRDQEVHGILERAVILSPDRRDEFLRALGYVGPDGAPFAEAGTRAGTGRAPGRGAPAAGAGPSAAAWAALRANRLDEAERLARRSAGTTAAEQADAANILGQVALNRRDFPAAEQRFRQSLERRPGQRDVQASLYAVLLQQGRLEEADRLAGQAGIRPGRDSGVLRAEALRGRALREADAGARIAVLRTALAAQPDSAWIAFDLARLLKTQGQAEEARGIERELGRRGGPDALYAAAMLAEYDGRLRDSVSRLEAIRNRSPEMGSLLEASRRQLEVQRLAAAARAGADSPAARRLLEMARQPDPSGNTRAAVILAFGRLNQPSNLEAARRAADPDAAGTDPEARAMIAAALADAGRGKEADGLSRRAERDPRMAADLRRTVSIAPQGAAAPREAENWRAQLALARVYARSDRAEEATDLAEGVLRRNQDNVEARSVAGEVAVLRGQYGRAEQILADGVGRRADALQMALLEARIARARGDQARARGALETAARLRGAQLRSEIR